MKKLSRFVTVFFVSVIFVSPLSALAACPIGYTLDLSNSAYCVSSSNSLERIANTPSSPSGSGGGINLTVITPYSSGIINLINGILVPVLMAIAFIVFLWGVFKYFIWGAESDTERATGRQFVLWGIIGFVIILCLWGLVAIVTGGLSLTPGGKAPNTPTL